MQRPFHSNVSQIAVLNVKYLEVCDSILMENLDISEKQSSFSMFSTFCAVWFLCEAPTSVISRLVENFQLSLEKISTVSENNPFTPSWKHPRKCLPTMFLQMPKVLQNAHIFAHIQLNLARSCCCFQNCRFSGEIEMFFGQFSQQYSAFENLVDIWSCFTLWSISHSESWKGSLFRFLRHKPNFRKKLNKKHFHPQIQQTIFRGA